MSAAEGRSAYPDCGGIVGECSEIGSEFICEKAQLIELGVQRPDAEDVEDLGHGWCDRNSCSSFSFVCLSDWRADLLSLLPHLVLVMYSHWQRRPDNDT